MLFMYAHKPLVSKQYKIHVLFDSPQTKKRKHLDSPNAGMPGHMFSRNGLLHNIKQEPNGTDMSSYITEGFSEVTVIF